MILSLIQKLNLLIVDSFCLFCFFLLFCFADPVSVFLSNFTQPKDSRIRPSVSHIYPAAAGLCFPKERENKKATNAYGNTNPQRLCCLWRYFNTPGQICKGV